MRICHLADCHLGFAQYGRVTSAGTNQRQADVAAAFTQTVSKVIELKPDAVLIAGDVFHHVRPSNVAIVHALREFGRLTRALPETSVVMVAGNHDAPRSTETGCILQMFTEMGIRVVDTKPERIILGDNLLEILAVPDVLGIVRPELVPQTDAKYKVLLMHGEVEGVLPAFSPEQAAKEVKRHELNSGQWDYVALGHFHTYQQVGDNAYYSGSLDYTSTSFWSEQGEKGFVIRDLETGEQEFHALELARKVVDLPPVEARGLSGAELNAAIRKAVAEGAIEGKIARLIVRDVPRSILRELDHKMVREYKRLAFHFQLDARNPELIRPTLSKEVRSANRRASLEQMVRNSFAKRELAPGVDGSALVDMGIRYLNEVEPSTEEETVEANV